MSLKVVSINARGLSDAQRFQKVVINPLGADIICLQETYWDEASAVKCGSVWDGNIYLNNGRVRWGEGWQFCVKVGFVKRKGRSLMMVLGGA